MSDSPLSDPVFVILLLFTAVPMVGLMGFLTGLIDMEAWGPGTAIYKEGYLKVGTFVVSHGMYLIALFLL